MTAQPLPQRYLFELYRADTRVWEHRFTEDDGETPIDITDWEFLSQYRLTTEDVDPVAEDAIEIIDGPGGVMRRTLTTTEAAKLPKGRVKWDLQSTVDGIVKTWLVNTSVRVSGDVSR